MSEWLIGVTAAAMLAAVARCLMPAGAVRQVGGLVCAMMLLWAVLKPLGPLTGTLVGDLDLSAQMQGREMQLKQQSEQMLKSLIEQECGTYIVDKAEQMGIDCQVSVACVLDGENVWMPSSVCVTGELSLQQRRDLEQLISADLGVASGQQEYLGGR